MATVKRNPSNQDFTANTDGWDLSAGTTVRKLTVTGANLTLTGAGTGVATIDSNQNVNLPSFQSITLTSTYTLTSQTAAQKLFNSSTNGAVAVLGSATYFFDGFYHLTSMSASSGSFGFALGGTAVLSSQQWHSAALKATTLTTAATMQTTFNTAANTTIVTASTATAGICHVWGKIIVTTGGTIIPQVSLGIAAAAVVGIGSYFHIWKAGSNSFTTMGAWS